MPASVPLTPSLEDYLEVMLDLREQNQIIRVTDLADRLGVAKSSVNQAVTKLVELSLLRHERYGPLELTDPGLERAKRIRERHRLLSQFFVEILGVDQKTAEKDACGMEHHLSPSTMERLLEYLKRTIG